VAARITWLVVAIAVSFGIGSSLGGTRAGLVLTAGVLLLAGIGAGMVRR